MKIAIVHISDFHVRENDKFQLDKIKKFSDSLNVLNDVDEYILVFSGDLTNRANKKEFINARKLVKELIERIKSKRNNFISALVVPGNHDIVLDKDSRKRSDIELYYKTGIVDEKVLDEYSFLDNFYDSLRMFNNNFSKDKLCDKKVLSFKDYKIQFNLINTAPFSTLEKNDKEIHYFPNNKLYMLEREENIDIAITVMHHSCESFRWEHKHPLEETINRTSEFLFVGHDHYPKEKTININHNTPTYISCAGELNFSNMNYDDSFNVLYLDTDDNEFSHYIFNWSSKDRLYRHNVIINKRQIVSKSEILKPQNTFIREIKKDTYNSNKDFTKYYVFPKLTNQNKNEFGKYEEVTNYDEIVSFLNNNNKIMISGPNRSGKTLFLKNLYFELTKEHIPLFLSIQPNERIKYKKIIKTTFEEQYGENEILFERFLQTDKKEKYLLIDGFDNLDEKGQSLLLKEVELYFENVVISSVGKSRGIIEDIKDELGNRAYQELRIKPFFISKRHLLVENICRAEGISSDENVRKINNSLDSIVQNNTGLFSLTPDFLVRYINYYINNSYYDYAAGEATFNKVFEYELFTRIISIVPRQDVDEILTIFEEITGFMYTKKIDVISIRDINMVVDNYNMDYGYNYSTQQIINIGISAGLLANTGRYEFYFSNKNYFSYFVAKYLLRIQNSPDGNIDGIKYAIDNICFGVNSDIILFLTYLSSNIKLIQLIIDKAQIVFSNWESINFEKGNISFLNNESMISKSVKRPNNSEQKEYIDNSERVEEKIYEEDVIEAKGIFDYDESNALKYPYNVMIASKYAEMICKSLPTLNNILKMPVKESIVAAAYAYPSKLAYQYLKPINDNYGKICDDLMKYAFENDLKKKNGLPMTRDDVKDIVAAIGMAMLLSTYNHYAELCTSPKTIHLLDKPVTDISSETQRLFFFEMAGNTDAFLKEVEIAQKDNKSPLFKYLSRKIVKKHLLVNPGISNKKRQFVIDKLMGGKGKKELLINMRKER